MVERLMGERSVAHRGCGCQGRRSPTEDAARSATGGEHPHKRGRTMAGGNVIGGGSANPGGPVAHGARMPFDVTLSRLTPSQIASGFGGWLAPRLVKRFDLPQRIEDTDVVVYADDPNDAEAPAVTEHDLVPVRPVRDDRLVLARLVPLLAVETEPKAVVLFRRHRCVLIPR